MRIVKILGVVFMIVCATGCGVREHGIDTKEPIMEESVEWEQPEREMQTEQQEQKTNSEPLEIESTQANTESEDEPKPERIICWGDSLTYGQGGDGVTYPSVLAEKLKLSVINYGIQGETARQIAIRMGVLPMSSGAFEIPAETEPVALSLWQWGEDPIMMRLGDCGMNPCKIAGVSGTISYQAQDNQYYFTRTEPGDKVAVPEGTQVEMYADTDKRASDIIVLFAGTNLPPDRNTVGELIEMEKQMIEYLGTERYVVIGLTSKTLIPDVEPINEALHKAFGEHFLDIRAYFLERGLEDAGLEMTEQDALDLAAGEIPASLRVDEVHGNQSFYRLIGEQVCLKLKELGYISQEDQKK